MRSREDIIKDALQAKISESMLFADFFTADDILAVANIRKGEVDVLMKKSSKEIESEIENFIKSLDI